MGAATVRVYGPLNDFLPEHQRHVEVPVEFYGTPAVKDVIEALGIPHVEVAQVRIGGQEVPLETRLTVGARVAVYPAFSLPELGGLGPLEPPRPIRFVLDVHLGALARNLRLLGIDADVPENTADAILAEISAREDRVLLTRDVALLKRGRVRFGYCPRSADPETQLIEVAHRYALVDVAAPFTRCLRCNGELLVATEDVTGEVPPRVAREQQVFQRCARCGQLYWAGSHHRVLSERVRTWMEALRRPGS